MANRWETEEAVIYFIWGKGDSKITVDGDCSNEIKGHLLLGGKVTTNQDSILKIRDIQFSLVQFSHSVVSDSL